MMANDIRPEVSQKNPYWIGKHRYYELKHFCLQYPIWKKAYLSLDALSRRPADLQVFVKSGQMKGDPTERCVQSRLFFADRMEMVEQAAIGADPELYQYLIRGVTEGLSYDALKMKYDMALRRPDGVRRADRRVLLLLVPSSAAPTPGPDGSSKAIWREPLPSADGQLHHLRLQ